MLERQTKIIGYKVWAMREYEWYLQKVMEAHPDEYNEIMDIKNRYETLFNSNDKLWQEQQAIEMEYEREKAETNEY